MGGSITNRTRHPLLAARVLLTLAAVVGLPGCSHDPPTAPPGTFALTGHLRLTGYLVDANGRFAGTRVVNDADGVEVELRFGPASLGRTNTRAGTYRFDGLRPGAYRVFASVIGEVADASRELTIVDRDLTAGDTLTVISRGDLFPIPNPSPDVVYVLFDVPDSADVAVRILDMQGRVQQHLLTKRVQGLQQVLWNGRDDAGELVPDRMYWITFEAGEDKRAQLLFR